MPIEPTVEPTELVDEEDLRDVLDKMGQTKESVVAKPLPQSADEEDGVSLDEFAAGIVQ